MNIVKANPSGFSKLLQNPVILDAIIPYFIGILAKEGLTGVLGKAYGMARQIDLQGSPLAIMVQAKIQAC